MEKRKWLWKRKPSERSPGESESSGSLSSHSERFSDEQDELKDSPNDVIESPEVTSKVVSEDNVKHSIKILTEKLSAALVNVSAKEDLVKQHAKVAEEAVAGWEKAENEVVVLKQQLEAAVQQNLAHDVRVNHLDGALKECVRQLRQAREEQEQKITDVLAEKTKELESAKTELENQLNELKSQVEAHEANYPAPIDPNLLVTLQSLQKENSVLKIELLSRTEELEIRTIERDLNAQAAESASKQQLESIKKVAKLEAECRRLQSLARKSSIVNDYKPIAASSSFVDSFSDSQSDSGERLPSVDSSNRKKSKFEQNESELSCSDSWASALIAELDQFKNEKVIPKNVTASSVEIEMMDDFLEMERLAALPETDKETPKECGAIASESVDRENPLKPELEEMVSRVVELQEKLQKLETEKGDLEKALNESQSALKASQDELIKAEIRLEELQQELKATCESKELLEFQLIGMEVEARSTSANVEALKAEVEKERRTSSELAAKYQELENELQRKSEEVEHQQAANLNNEVKIKQEDLAVAADKLAECQKTIASLGRQLKSLATLEDFLTDTANLPGLTTEGSPLSDVAGEQWKCQPSDGITPKRGPNSSAMLEDNSNHLLNGNDEDSSGSSASANSSVNHVPSSKSRNGFGKLFSRNKSSIQL